MLCRRSSLRFLASLFSAFAKHRFSKPLRYLTKLVLAKPFHRKSRHFFSLPCQCIRSKTLPQRNVTVHHFSFANHISAFLCHSFASHCSASSAFALPVCASQCRREAVGRNALPLHSSSPHSLRKASPCLALPCRCHSAPCVAVAHLLKSRQCRCNANHCCAAQSHRTANLTQPCRCQAAHRTASANQGRQCHALALRPSSHKRCR